MSHQKPGYVSPAQCALYVGNTLLDDAASIEYAVITSREAYYGFHSMHYSAVATGRTITTGAVTIQFRAVGYLSKAIMHAVSVKPGVAALNRERGRQGGMLLEEYNRSLGRVEQGDSLADLVTKMITKPLNEYTQFAAEVKKSFPAWGAVANKVLVAGGGLGISLLEQARQIATNVLPMTEATANNPASEQTPGPVNLIVAYGKHIDEPERVEILEDVHFTSMAKRVDNSNAELSGAPVMERYEFMCRAVRPLGSKSVGPGLGRTGTVV